MNKKNLHILFIAGWYPSRVLPSNGDFIQRHAEAIALRNRVTVIHVITDLNTDSDITITDETINEVRTLIAYIRPSKLKIISFYHAYKRLLKIAGNIDIIHVNKLYPTGIIALIYKFLKNINYLITEHHSIYQKPFRNSIGYFEKQLSKCITKNASYVCPVSDDLGSAMKDFGLKGNYISVPNVVFTSIFTPKKDKKQPVFTITHISNMVALKNVEGILMVVKELKKYISKFQFNLIGNNPNKYKDFIIKNDIELKNINFISHIPQKELAMYYRESDVFVLFSNIENLPCVILESFSSGTAVISSNVGGISEYFPKNFGILINKGDQKQLLEAILHVHSNFEKQNAKTMHQYVVDHFSPKSIALQFSKLYSSMI